MKRVNPKTNNNKTKYTHPNIPNTSGAMKAFECIVFLRISPPINQIIKASKVKGLILYAIGPKYSNGPQDSLSGPSTLKLHSGPVANILGFIINKYGP